MIRFEGDDRRTVEKAAELRRDARKAATKARPKSEKATRGREIDNGFRQYIRRQPCEAAHLGGCSGPLQHAHVSYQQHGIPNSFGRGVKNHDRHGNPLCAGHHELQHRMGDERAFWMLVGKDAYETAAGHFAAYEGLRSSPNKRAGE